MRELLLLRHAKSNRDEPAAGDHERDLARRGERAAPQVGRLLRAEGLVPDLALCSTATRAKRTWELAAAELGREVPVRYLRTLYLAPPSRLLVTVRQQASDVGRLLLVGHNRAFTAWRWRSRARASRACSQRCAPSSRPLPWPGSLSTRRTGRMSPRARAGYSPTGARASGTEPAPPASAPGGLAPVGLVRGRRPREARGRPVPLHNACASGIALK